MRSDALSINMIKKLMILHYNPVSCDFYCLVSMVSEENVLIAYVSMVSNHGNTYEFNMFNI